MEPPPGYFTTAPAVESIDPTEDGATYGVAPRDEACGSAETFLQTVVEGDTPLGAYGGLLAS